MRIKAMKKLASVILPIVAGGAAALYTPLVFWFDMKEGLIAFLGFVAASLMQVMPITANFVQADRLNPTEAEKIVRSLTRQQHYWIGLLSATILTLLVVIVSSALKSRLDSLTCDWHGLTYSSIPVFLIAGLFTFVLIKMLGLLQGVLSLHNLRAELVLISARRSALEKQAAMLSNVREAKPELPLGYGSILEPKDQSDPH